ncbi:Uncharacterised protein [Sphingobacterium multivorum]|jgi:hypothetical protein|nr:Uncharacterised protein [Sphingobacterium multivorum]
MINRQLTLSPSFDFVMPKGLTESAVSSLTMTNE